MIHLKTKNILGNYAFSFLTWKGGYEDLDGSSTPQPAPTTSHLIAALQSPTDGSRRFPPPSVIEDIGEMPSISVVPDGMIFHNANNHIKTRGITEGYFGCGRSKEN